jgi:hypothetical protein
VNPLHEHMPALVRHAGVWEGTYRTVTTDGVEVDRHASRIEVSFPDDGAFAYVQKNRFTWPDGRVVEAEHPGVYRDGRLWWDTGLIQGSAWQGDDRTCTLTWERTDAPGAHLYELIVLAPDGRTRARTWHWFRDGECYQRTLIDEAKVA